MRVILSSEGPWEHQSPGSDLLILLNNPFCCGWQHGKNMEAREG